MQIRFLPKRPSGDHALVLPIAGPAREALDTLGDSRPGIEAAMKRQRFEGEAGTACDHYLERDGGRRLLLVGTGSEAKDDRAERLGSAVAARLLVSAEREAVIDLSGADFDADAAARVALGAVLRAWRQDRYRTRLKEKLRPTLDLITLVGAPEGSEALWADRYAQLAEGIMFARELVAEPANIIYPESFVERCRALEPLGVEIRVIGEAEMAKLGMGAMLGVSQGSVREAQLLVMSWNGGAAGATPTVLIGKGVTFDTGGISIKPAAGMESMKWDMGGAGAVAGAMRAIAGRKAKANVVGICGLVENMPDGNAQRPGDVVTTMSGQTVEVINTDAEGRLVLCDAISWAQKEFAPKTIIDLATLTGAMVVALGHEYAGIYANDEPLAAALIEAGNASADKLWRMPLGDAYDRLIDSPIADIKNVGPREGGSITAAQFIKRFVDDGVAWAHLDIAGMAWSDKPGTLFDKGATGYGVRLLDTYIEQTVEA